MRFVPKPRCPTCGAAYSPHTCAGWHRALFAALLALLLSLSAPAWADEHDDGENYYDYLGIHLLPPQTCVSPCEVEWPVVLRGVPVGIAVKRCPGFPEIIQDRYLTAYFSGLALGRGRLKVLIGDNHPGRTQVFCARVLHLFEEHE